MLYDGLCPICLRSMTVIRYLDVLDRLRYADLESGAEATIGATAPSVPDRLSIDDLRHEMHIIEPGGVHRGYTAFRRVARALPALWVLVPFMYVPGSRIGETLYARIARTRLRLGGCGDGVCERRADSNAQTSVNTEASRTGAKDHL